MTTVSPAATVAPPATSADVERQDEGFIELLSGLNWKLGVRALAELYRNDDPHRALDLLIEFWRGGDSEHRRLADRVSQTWARHHREDGHRKTDSETLADALRELNTDADSWLRCQLPSAQSTVSQDEDALRHAVRAFWKGGLSHG